MYKILKTHLVFALSLVTTLAYSQSHLPAPALAPKGGGSTGVGGGGDVFDLPGEKTVFVDFGERVLFSPKKLSVYPELSAHLTKLEKLIPAFVRNLRDALEGNGPPWFFSIGTLKEINDENQNKSPLDTSLFKNKRQAAFFNGKEVIVNREIFETELDTQNQKNLLIHEALRVAFFKGNQFTPESSSLRRLVSLIVGSDFDQMNPDVYWREIYTTLLDCFEFELSGLEFEKSVRGIRGLNLNTMAISQLRNNWLFTSFIYYPPVRCQSCFELANRLLGEDFYSSFLELFYDKEKSREKFGRILSLDLESLLKKEQNNPTSERDYIDSLSVEERHRLFEQITPPIDPNFIAKHKFRNHHFSFFPVRVVEESSKSLIEANQGKYRIHFGVFRYGFQDSVTVGTLAFVVNVEKRTVVVFKIGEDESIKLADLKKPTSDLGKAMEKIDQDSKGYGLADGTFAKAKPTKEKLLENCFIGGGIAISLETFDNGFNKVDSIYGELNQSFFCDPNIFSDGSDFLKNSNLIDSGKDLLQTALSRGRLIRFRLYPETIAGLGAAAGNNEFIGVWDGLPGVSQKLFPKTDSHK